MGAWRESSFDAIRAGSSGSVQGRIRITEQGEIVAAKYATRESAAANLEFLTTATLLASLQSNSLSAEDSRHPPRWMALEGSSSRLPLLGLRDRQFPVALLPRHHG